MTTENDLPPGKLLHPYNMDPEKGGIKADSDKVRPELVPPTVIMGIAEVLTHGAKKYDDWNWAKGMSWSRVYGAVQRHLLAWYNRDTWDEETGFNHLQHALCGLSFLLYYHTHKKGDDDRPKP